MPEGHTIHRLARDLQRDLGGAPVGTDVRQDRFADAAARLQGRVLESASANGKHLFLHWEGAEIQHVHLGLFGKFRRLERPLPEPSDALRVRLIGATHGWDLTGAVTCDLRGPEVLDEVAARLGPDPLRADADPERFVRRAGRSTRPIGALVMDQKVIAGIGNVYRAEILHLLGIHPLREGRTVSEDELRAIWDLAVDQLRLGVRRNRIVTVPLEGRAASRIRRADAVHVYKQERCRTCGGRVEHTEIDGRNSFACPVCQPRRPGRPRRPRSTAGA